jgi:CspA family cold shock protein
MNQTVKKKLRRKKGIVRYYNEKKGYGIIEGKDGRDILVYIKDMDFLTLLDTGDEVDYEIKNSEQGPRAQNVKICKDVLFRHKNETSDS